MTDFFALLDQPRAPWLDPAGLKEAYHRKTLRLHPDTAAPADQQDAFAEINEAYRVLQDPRRRLHHLLALEGRVPSSAEQTVPEELQRLFPALGAITQRAKTLLEKTMTASNALSRSLLKSELLELQKETTELREQIQALSDAALAQLRVVDSNWRTGPSGEIAALTQLYFTFSYLSRWSAQLDEIAFQLSLH